MRTILAVLLVLLSGCAIIFGPDEGGGPAESSAEQDEAFMAANARKSGVITLPSGLQYSVVKEGKGAMPSSKDLVTVQYRGTLTNGVEFDSTYQRRQPSSFYLDKVIAGWTEGLQLMREGSVYRFFIPSKLGYGSRGSQGIPPDAALIFDVELMYVMKQ